MYHHHQSDGKMIVITSDSSNKQIPSAVSNTNVNSLSWPSYKHAFADILSEVIRSEKFVDVTIICDDNRRVRAHSVILSIVSPMFKSLLEQCCCEETVISLVNIPSTHMNWLLHFMYEGKVLVPNEELDSFLETAKALEIKSLCRGLHDNLPPKRPHEEKPTVVIEKKKIKKSVVNSKNRMQVPSFITGDESVHAAEQIIQVQSEEIVRYESGSSAFAPTGNNNYCMPDEESVDETIEVEDNDNTRHSMFHIAEAFQTSSVKGTHSLAPKVCNMCGRVYSNLSNLRQHVNLVHTASKQVACEICGKTFKSELYMKRHTVCVHNITPMKKVTNWRETPNLNKQIPRIPFEVRHDLSDWAAITHSVLHENMNPVHR